MMELDKALKKFYYRIQLHLNISLFILFIVKWTKQNYENIYLLIYYFMW